MASTWGTNLWGSNAWNSDVNLTAPSGVESTTSVTSVTVDATIQIGWGGLAWGEGEWGDLANPNIDVSGSAVTSNTGSVIISANADVTIDTTITGPADIGMNSATDSVIAGTSVLVELTGEESTSTVGNAFGGEIVTVEVTSPSKDAWGEEAYGNGSWGLGDGTSVQTGEPVLIGTANIAVTTNELIISEGNVDPSPDVSLVGVGMTITTGVGTVTAGADVNTTGSEISTDLGNVILTGTADIQVSGVEITGQTGQLEYEVIYSLSGAEATSTTGDAFGGEVVEVQVTTASATPWGETAWGDGFWGVGLGTDISIGADVVLTPSIEVNVTGVQLNWTIGTETITADANLTLSGVSAEIFQGDEKAFTDYTAQVTGQQLSSSVNNVLAGISQLVTPTGVTATISTGIMGINAWAVVEPNASTTWSVVDKAAA
jgi:hypothetical protein